MIVNHGLSMNFGVCPFVIGACSERQLSLSIQPSSIAVAQLLTLFGVAPFAGRMTHEAIYVEATLREFDAQRIDMSVESTMCNDERREASYFILGSNLPHGDACGPRFGGVSVQRRQIPD